MPTRPARRPRADGIRNRARIVAAAREAFAAGGIVVSLDDIARNAGVGPGTVHRHFPTKRALLDTVVSASIDQLLAHAERLTAELPPAAALFAFFSRVIDHAAGDRAFTEVLTDAAGGAHTGDALFETLAVLLIRAQRTGSIRGDVTTVQVRALLVAAFAAGDCLGGDTAERRHLTTVIYDGLRRQPG